MISIDKALLRQLLLIERPWEVRDYRLDVRKRRCDVWIGQRSPSAAGSAGPSRRRPGSWRSGSTWRSGRSVFICT